LCIFLNIMNFGLYHLSLSRAFINSPLISNRGDNYHVQLSCFSNFFKSLFDGHGSMKLNHCYLLKFLDKSIVLRSDYEEFSKKTYKHHLSYVNIENSWFDNVKSTSKGSAIETNYYCFLIVKSCVFSNLYSPKEGGAIFHFGTESNISKCCFSSCYCGELKDSNSGGNIFSLNGNCRIYYCHAKECAPVTSKGGDSLYQLYDGLIMISEFNGTRNCTPNYGSIGGAFQNHNENSTISFSIFTFSNDCVLFESWNSIATLNKCNFINNTLKSCAIYSFQSTVYIKSCSFYGNSLKNTIGTVIFSESFTDYSVSGAIVTSTTLQSATGFSICKIDQDTPFYTSSSYNIPLQLLFILFSEYSCL